MVQEAGGDRHSSEDEKLFSTRSLRCQDLPLVGHSTIEGPRAMLLRDSSSSITKNMLEMQTLGATLDLVNQESVPQLVSLVIGVYESLPRLMQPRKM